MLSSSPLDVAELLVALIMIVFSIKKNPIRSQSLNTL